MTDQNTKK